MEWDSDDEDSPLIPDNNDEDCGTQMTLDTHEERRKFNNAEYTKIKPL